jgi:hypothetical protein
MKAAVAKLQAYMNTYTQQEGYQDYADKTYVDDVLYGLGLSLNAIDYTAADGFDRFKAYLRLHLEGRSKNRQWSATGLPPGLEFDPETRIISGTPTAPGMFTITVTPPE